MKKILIITNCLLVVFITLYCEKKKTTCALSNVDIEGNVKNIQKIYMSRFFNNVQYVPLEDNVNHPLSWISSSLSDFSEKYILNSDGKICILYDNEGHFIRQIGKQGRGPGEYTGLSCVYLINEKIYLYDYHTDDLIGYKLDGTFIKRHKSGFTGNGKYRLEYREPIMLNDSMIFGNVENRSGQEEYKALIIDIQGNVKYFYKNYIQFKLGTEVSHAKSPGKATIFTFKDKIYFKEFLNDTLFQMEDQFRLIPRYIFNLGKYKESLSERGMRWDQIDLLSYIDLDNIFQTENYLILVCDFNKNFPVKRLTPEIIKLPGLEDYTLWYNTTSILGIYDKRTGNLGFSEPTSTDNHLFTSGFYNDIDAGPRFMPDKMINDSVMVMKIRFEHLIEHIKSDDFKNNTPKYPDRKKRLEALIDSLIRTEFNNPVLVFVTFNKSNL